MEDVNRILLQTDADGKYPLITVFKNLKIENEEMESHTLISDAEIDIPVRVYNCLSRAGINTVEELLRLSSDDFSRIRNLGRKNLEWFLNFQNNYQDTRIQNKKTEPDRDKIKSLSRFFDTLISQ